MGKVAKCNRDFLDSNFPGLSNTIDSRTPSNTFTFITDPSPNIGIDGRTIHSKRNPNREAHNLVHDIPIQDGVVLLFLGLGLGFQLEILKKRFAKKNTAATIIVVERSTESFSLLCRNRDISFLKNVHLFIGESLRDAQAFIQKLGAFSFSGYRIVKLRGSYSLHIDYYNEIESCFKESMAGKLSDLLTRYAFEALWMRNTIDNIPSLVGSSSISSLKGKLQGKPALIVNAGPSLLNQLQGLRNLQNRMHIIAVDTVLTPLLKAGICPDFVVTLDAGFANSLDFRYLFTGRSSCRDMNLVADIVTNPIILRHWSGPVFFNGTSLVMPGSSVPDSPIMPLFHLQTLSPVGDQYQPPLWNWPYIWEPNQCT